MVHKPIAMQLKWLAQYCCQAHTIGAGGLGVRFLGQQLATAATFLRSCVAQALCRGDGPHHSLHASEEYRENNEDLIFS